MAKGFNEVAAEIRRRIESGEYPATSPLPAERALGEAFGVHRATLRRALARLEADGIVRRAPGDRPYPVSMGKPAEGVIGLFAANRDDPFARSIIANGMVETLRKRGSALRLVWADDHALVPDVPLSAEMRSLAGLVLWPPSLTDVGHLRELRRTMPTVIVDTPVVGYESDFVGFDDDVAGYEATRHLIEQGHRRIAFVGSLHFVTTRYRLHGFARMMHRAGLEPLQGYEPLVYVDRLPKNTVDAYFQGDPTERPTALLCENDETAARLMPYLMERGIRVPEDMALMGFGGAQPTLLDALGMTTMEQPYAEVGRVAAEMLLDRIEGRRDGPPEEVRLPMTLRVRASSRKVAEAALPG